MSRRPYRCPSDACHHRLLGEFVGRWWRVTRGNAQAYPVPPSVVVCKDCGTVSSPAGLSDAEVVAALAEMAAAE